MEQENNFKIAEKRFKKTVVNSEGQLCEESHNVKCRNVTNCRCSRLNKNVIEDVVDFGRDELAGYNFVKYELKEGLDFQAYALEGRGCFINFKTLIEL